jgi:hypothetical protein
MSPTPSPSLAAASGAAPVEAIRRAQARRLRVHAAACCAWLGSFALGWLALLAAARIERAMPAVTLAILVPLVGLALLASPVRPARRYTLNMLAATLFLPVALLFVAGSLEREPARPADASAGLDIERLYAGAVRIDESDLAGAGIVRVRSGAFADGNELRLLRFIDADAARAHLEMLTAALRGEPYADHDRRGVRVVQGVMPGALLLFERHGRDLLELRARDVAGGLARLAHQQVPTPGPDTAAAPAPARWPLFVAAALAHALAFVALIVWGGRHTTRIDAAPDVALVNAAALRARIVSFASSPRAPFDLVEAGEARIGIELPLGASHSHRITLALDATRHEVRVAERLGVCGDRPRDANEADLRGPGETPFDPSRPSADRVWQTTWQTTLVDPARLAAVPLRPLGLHAELPGTSAAALDGEGLLTALCALVTRSGWAWQPRFGAA